MNPPPVLHDAVVLAGGEGRRLGGTDKAGVLVAGRTMLDRVLDATRDARRVVVVAPPGVAPAHVETALEDPPLGGPVAGLDAGLARLGHGHAPVVVLACDVPLAAHAVPALLAALEAHPDADGVRLLDADDRPQPLLAVYRRGPLDAALDRLRAADGVRGASVRRLLDGLALVDVPDTSGASADGDTWEAVAELEHAVARRDAMGSDEATGTPAAPGSELHRWVALLVEELGVEPDAVDVDAMLDLARETAHGVARPAVPLTAFLTGYAVGAGSGDRAAFETAVARVTGLVERWAGSGGGAAR